MIDGMIGTCVTVGEILKLPVPSPAQVLDSAIAVEGSHLLLAPLRFASCKYVPAEAPKL